LYGDAKIKQYGNQIIRSSWGDPCFTSAVCSPNANVITPFVHVYPTEISLPGYASRKSRIRDKEYFAMLASCGSELLL
jgi:hypothetical protein